MNEKTYMTRILEISIPALIVFAVSWGIYSTKLNAQELKILDLEKKYESILEVKTDLALVKKDTEYIKTSVLEIKVALKEHSK